MLAGASLRRRRRRRHHHHHHHHRIVVTRIGGWMVRCAGAAGGAGCRRRRRRRFRRRRRRRRAGGVIWREPCRIRAAFDPRTCERLHSHAHAFVCVRVSVFRYLCRMSSSRVHMRLSKVFSPRMRPHQRAYPCEPTDRRLLLAQTVFHVPVRCYAIRCFRIVFGVQGDHGNRMDLHISSIFSLQTCAMQLNVIPSVWMFRFVAEWVGEPATV